MFRDRTDAGEQLADELLERGIDADVVLTIPRGGLPVGRVVADRLGVPLDVVAARKLGAPWNEELAIGAVASDGTVWRNDELIESHSVSEEYIREEVETEREVAREKVERYRGDRPAVDLTGKTVVLVDDGVATGATAIACLRQIANAGAERVVLAVPVAPGDTVRQLADEADEVVAVRTPSPFGAVGRFYDDFSQVSDAEAREYL